MFLVSAFCIVSPPVAVPYYLYVVHARESAATGATLQVLALFLEQGGIFLMRDRCRPFAISNSVR